VQSGELENLFVRLSFQCLQFLPWCLLGERCQPPHRNWKTPYTDRECPSPRQSLFYASNSTLRHSKCGEGVNHLNALISLTRGEVALRRSLSDKCNVQRRRACKLIRHGVHLDAGRNRNQSVLRGAVARKSASYAGVGADDKVHRLTSSSTRLVVSHANLVAGAIRCNGYSLRGGGDVSLVRLALRLERDVVSH